MENESSDEKNVVNGIVKNEESSGDNMVSSPTAAEELKRDTPDIQKGGQEKLQSENESSDEKNVVSGDNMVSSPTAAAELKRDTPDIQKDDQKELQSEMKSLDISEEHLSFENVERGESSNDEIVENRGFECEDQEETNSDSAKREKNSNSQMVDMKRLDSEDLEETNQPVGEVLGEDEEAEPVFDGTEIPGMEANSSLSTRSLDLETEVQGYGWPDKAAALTNFVKEKGVVAVATILRRLSGKKDEDGQSFADGEEKNDNLNSSTREEGCSAPESKTKDVTPKTVERSLWNPLNYIKISRDADVENKTGEGQDQHVHIRKPILPLAMRGRVLLYTRLGCQESRQIRLFLQRNRMRYVEINIDVYPSRKLELERIAGSAAVPKVFFNENLIGGLSELLVMEESGKLGENINELITKEPSHLAPLPPLSGEDDVSSSGMVDEYAVIVRKMKEFIVFRDRFYKMRRVTNCFLGSEAVDFLSEDQYLEREEAIEFGRKLASKYFFQHVLEENIFEDGNHLYRLLDHDPVVSQCHNIPRGIIIIKPKPIIEIASRLRFLSFAIFEAYTSEDGKHVDYRSIHGSEEFARYLRTVEELQRVELQDMSREEKIAFFINLYNMMAIHAILVWGYPVGPLERRRLLGDFKYVIGGCTYSLSAIYNGILRANQRPPYNLIKPFDVKDKRLKVALPYPEPLVHFALVFGTRSGPALRCYSPGDIDKELMEAARNFLRNGGLIVDAEAKVVSASKILRWYPGDFGKNEVEVLKHAANYLEPAKSEELLELLATTQLKVTYQPFDWSLNY
ncbi:uncharacterized protein LOC122668071 isoform X2 [Telopea speciosissima]|uniref:uncharacterized protein LOC122668071 isoform X2 n=1 Tax=Telopea speciosissima TaxID=54955 RepID=UPI001CC5ABD9|nr:uncharacterized protein LOC122668071 isoform X2 [Telopea speciosissima]